MTKGVAGFSVESWGRMGVAGGTGVPLACIRDVDRALLQAASSMASAWARSAYSASLAVFSEGETIGGGSLEKYTKWLGGSLATFLLT